MSRDRVEQPGYGALAESLGVDSRQGRMSSSSLYGGPTQSSMARHICGLGDPAARSLRGYYEQAAALYTVAGKQQYDRALLQPDMLTASQTHPQHRPRPIRWHPSLRAYVNRPVCLVTRVAPS